MILEVAVLDIKPNQNMAFEAAFKKAQNIISSMNGYISHELQRSIENPSRYILLGACPRTKTVAKITELS